MSNYINAIRDIQKNRLKLTKQLAILKLAIPKKKKGKKAEKNYNLGLKEHNEQLAILSATLVDFDLAAQKKLKIIKSKMSNTLGMNISIERDEIAGFEEAERIHKLLQADQTLKIERYTKNIIVFKKEMIVLHRVIKNLDASSEIEVEEPVAAQVE